MSSHFAKWALFGPDSPVHAYYIIFLTDIAVEPNPGLNELMTREKKSNIVLL